MHLEKYKHKTRVQLLGVLVLMGDHLPSLIHWRWTLNQFSWGFGGAEQLLICEKCDEVSKYKTIKKIHFLCTNVHQNIECHLFIGQ